MASQWRIRHKLMLGLGLVVGVIALLLGGTAYGLWSYYVTTNNIRSKLAELMAAERAKTAAEQLTREFATDEQVEIGYNDLDARIGEARKQLEAYKEQLQSTLDHHRDPGNGMLEREYIGVLEKHITTFRELVKALYLARTPVDGIHMSPNNVADRADAEKARKALDEEARLFRTAAGDLHNTIYDELNNRINESRSHYQITLWILVPTSAVGLFLVIGMLGSFYAWVFNPIRDLEAGVNRVAKGDFDYRIEVHSGDEMEDLGAAFNDMTRRLQEVYSDLARQVNERSRQLVRSERLASVGFLAAGVAHEINNPLASIAFCSEALEARLADLLGRLRASGLFSEEQEVFAKYLKMIQEEAFRCKNITERLLAFSRTGERRREPTDLAALVQSVLDVTQHLQNHRGKHIGFEVSPERGSEKVLAWVNAEEIKSVVLNLVVNALDSMDDGGRLTIRLAQRDGMAQLQFTDTGCGMTQEVLENIFEPFFTRSRTGKGTGLGLTISHRIVTQHGGELEASSPGPNRGSTFTVRLPLRQPDEAPALPGPEGPREVRAAA